MEVEKLIKKIGSVLNFKPESKFHKNLIFFAKILFTLMILFFIFSRIDFKETITHFSKLSFNVIVIIFFTSLLKAVVLIFNWKKLLEMDPAYKCNLREIIQSYFVGISLRFLLPGGHAVYGKMFFVSNSKKSSFLSVSLEKFIQTVSIFWVASFSAIFYFSENRLVFLTIFLLVSLLPFLLYFFSKYINIKLVEEFRKSYSHDFLSLFIVYFFFIFITVFQYFFLIRHFQEVNFLDVMLAVPLILVANTIPITYSGLGLRESFSIYFLKKNQVSPISSLTTSLVIFIFNSVIPAIIGLIIILMKKKDKKNDNGESFLAVDSQRKHSKYLNN